MSTEKKIKVKQKGKVIATRKVSMSDVVAARATLASIENGQETVKRFSLFARAQHFLLFISVTVLAITGLSQTFSDTPLAFGFIQLIGGRDRLQLIHHLFAIILITLIVVHIYLVLDGFFVKSKPATMFFDKSDLKNLYKMVGLLLGFNQKLPRFDRYKTDEKFMYWITAFSVVVSLITGLFIWFPVQTTFLIPGSAFPFFIAIHRWQAILLVVVVLLLHTFQVLRKKSQVNIWNGDIAVEEMKYEHPVELAWLERISRLDDELTYPAQISLSPEGTAKVETAPEQAPETGSDEKVTENTTNVIEDVKIVPTGDGILDENVEEIKDDSKIGSNKFLILEETGAANPETPPTFAVDDDQADVSAEKRLDDKNIGGD